MQASIQQQNGLLQNKLTPFLSLSTIVSLSSILQVPMEILKFLYFNLFMASVFLTVSAIDPYSKALLSLKSELVDEYNGLKDWLVPSSGNPTEKPYACFWSGVKCNNNSTHVIALDLSMKNLGGVMSGKQFNVFTELTELNLSYNSFSGQLAVGIFNLTNLKSLDISRNNFSGHFPGGISGLQNLIVFDAFSNSFEGPLPVQVSQLGNLKILNLAGSYFEGPIPSEYGSFKSLEFIHLAGNLLSGNIPPELGNLKTVTHMEIGYNSYNGFIPWQLGNMSELRYLDIAEANLSGTIPKQFSNLTKLQTLFLFKNYLTGSVPEELGTIIPLTNLDLSDNLISGSIPESFVELKNLRLLSLMYNDMSGTVTEVLAQLPSLETLLIWNNFFNGSLPKSLGRNSKLKWLDVSTNNFAGSIPPDICARGELTKLILFSNDLSGDLPQSLSNCSSLVRLRLENNSLSGKINLKFNNLPDISYVDLSSNKFNGGIPSDVCQAGKLQYFNVSNNPTLGGMIPDQTWSLPELQNFSASSCGISGNLPSFDLCKSLTVIDLDHNNLSGSVPRTFSNCQTLASLDLSHNNLSGYVPEELASLPALGIVNLSHNNFDGQIPEKFGTSSSLVLLNVSFNQLSGSIPKNKLFRSMDSSAFVGNPKLCGAPLGPCPDSVAIIGSKGTRKHGRIILLCAGILLILAASVLAMIVYTRRGSNNQWKMVSFAGLPQFTENDVLRSISPAESTELRALSPSVCKAVLPTGIPVLVKHVEGEAKSMQIMKEFITRLGNARQKNLIRLLGFCYNKHQAYLIYDYLPNGNLSEKIAMKKDWAAKYRIIIGIARGLSFLHHNCYPPISHGDLKSSNILFDEYMEPYLADYGFKNLSRFCADSTPAPGSKWVTGEVKEAVQEELCMDVKNFGGLILEILTDGKLPSQLTSIHSGSREALLRDICSANGVDTTSSVKEEIKLVLEVALLCTKSKLLDRPSMEEILKRLSALKQKEDGRISKMGRQ